MTNKEVLRTTMIMLINLFNDGKREFTIDYEKKDGEARVLKVTIEEVEA